MKPPIVLLSLVAVLPGCALRVPGLPVLQARVGGGASTGGSSAGSQTTGESDAERAAREKAWVRQEVDKHKKEIVEAQAMLETCCGDRNLLEDINATYPSTPFVKKYRQLRNLRSWRYDDKGPEVTELRASLDQLDQKVVDAVRLPKDRYAKSDGRTVRRTFKEYAEGYTKKPVLDVVLLAEDWNRQSGSQWIGDRLVNYDQGFVASYVVVKKDDTTGEVWSFIPRKDWLDKEKIKFDVYVPAVVREIRLKNVAMK